jgi:peptidoglycan/LPS O-acetylase OafA/YrhL
LSCYVVFYSTLESVPVALKSFASQTTKVAALITDSQSREGTIRHSTVANERYYRPELDVLRLIAFLLVFCTHRMDLAPIDPAKYPWRFNLSLIGIFGVPVFFLLSAFLITELLMREHEQLGKIHLKAFYLRRILRIWPLYFLVFFGLTVLTHFVYGMGTKNHSAWLAFTLFAGNWYICLKGWLAYPVNPLWSISVEEQFYIVMPLIALFTRRRGLMLVNWTLLVVAPLINLNYALHPTTGFSSQWTNSFVQFQFFAAGTLLSLYLKRRIPQWHLAVRFVGVAVAISCWLIAYLQFGVQADNPRATVPGALIGWPLVLFGTILLFLSLLGTPAKYLPNPLVYLGRISYGLYLIHAAILYLIFHSGRSWLQQLSAALHVSRWNDGFGTIIVLGMTILLASLSYRFFERPFLNLKKRFTFIPSRD